MSWTDERVDLLSRLWMEGRSASQIAAELGSGITRNAVIGKVHRLGLAGRAKPVVSPGQGRLKGKLAPALDTEVPIEAAPETVPSLPATPPIIGPDMTVAIPTSERVTIMELRESSCRWPMGDPSQAEFRFCGARTGIGAGPYCAAHARLAFQPTHDRRRDRVERYARIA
jgi:GcrA cell cycle regulator